jgi:hypothetical protein
VLGEFVIVEGMTMPTILQMLLSDLRD